MEQYRLQRNKKIKGFCVIVFLSETIHIFISLSRFWNFYLTQGCFGYDRISWTLPDCLVREWSTSSTRYSIYYLTHILCFIYNFGLMGPGTRFFLYQCVPLQIMSPRTLFFLIRLQYHCILGLSDLKTLHTRDKSMSKKSRMPRLQKHCSILLQLFIF